MLKIAIAKGRIFKESIELLQKINIIPNASELSTRKLIISTNTEVEILVVRATDVPVYVEYGGADLGITGKDTLIEYNNSHLYELLNLNIAKCRLMTAGKQEFMLKNNITVATKYTYTTKKYYSNLGINANIIKLYGSMELAPLVGIADVIVDIVDTGKTLQENNLYPLDLITEISSYLVANQASFKIKYKQICPIINSLKTIINEEHK